MPNLASPDPFYSACRVSFASVPLTVSGSPLTLRSLYRSALRAAEAWACRRDLALQYLGDSGGQQPSSWQVDDFLAVEGLPRQLCSVGPPMSTWAWSGVLSVDPAKRVPSPSDSSGHLAANATDHLPCTPLRRPPHEARPSARSGSTKWTDRLAGTEKIGVLPGGEEASRNRHGPRAFLFRKEAHPGVIYPKIAAVRKPVLSVPTNTDYQQLNESPRVVVP
ncbi:hypothetical protein Q8A67_022617 [Cirrhinus molitorella]|uniref:Uncharacterized protein n=1 Tax=Cirrhinus molitorella TaxID=172907 RepID=A0AA88TM26_9TELE|nr:hypothetical protein Q8A67_022617 [Cirrhinus molitorella]